MLSLSCPFFFAFLLREEHRMVRNEPPWENFCPNIRLARMLMIFMGCPVMAESATAIRTSWPPPSPVLPSMRSGGGAMISGPRGIADLRVLVYDDMSSRQWVVGRKARGSELGYPVLTRTESWVFG